MQLHPRVLANQILIRKASRQLEEAASLEDSWQVLASTLEALDFDGVACQLSQWSNGRALSLSEWSRCGEESLSECWSVSIPLRAGEKALGRLQIWRVLSRDRLLFQFSSILDTLIPPFERQLKRFYEAQETKYT
jgi:hypothetical protein